MALSATARRLLSSSSRAASVKLSGSQNVFLAGASAVFGILNTHRGDLIANITETTTPSFILDSLKGRMLKSESGTNLLKEKPEVNSSTINLAELRLLPKSTFGFAYYQYMSSHGYSPDERTPVRFVDDPDHAYIILRYRQTHDFVHCLSGLPPTVLGELAQKLFEFFHFGLPMCAVAALGGPFRLTFNERVKLAATYLPWSIACNRSTKQLLLSVPFEEYFDRDLDEFRRQLGFIRAPELEDSSRIIPLHDDPVKDRAPMALPVP